MLTNKYIMIPIIFVLAYMIRFIWEEKRISRKFLTVIVLSIIMVLPVGMSEIQGDRANYVHHFLNFLPESPALFLEPLIQYFPESGWEAFNMIIKYFVANNGRVFVIATSLFIILPVIYRFSKDIQLFEIAVFIFMCFGTYPQAENGLRQACATAILVFGYRILTEKNVLSYLILVLVAATFHVSALIFLILFPLRYIRVDGMFMKVSAILSVLLFVFYHPFMRLVCWAFAGNRYVDIYTSWMLDDTSWGANPLRLIWIAIPLVLAYFNKERLEDKEKGFRFIVNISFVNLIISLFATKTWIFARFCFYFSTFEIFLICWELQYLFHGRKQILAYWCTIVFYYMYFGLNSV